MSKPISEIAGELRRLLNPAAGGERPFVVRAAWHVANEALMANRLIPFSWPRSVALRLFGAEIGRGVVLKPGVRVKFPWKLSLGAGAAIGEDVWIDNIERVEIGEKAVISQGAYLCTGNHDRRKRSMPLTAKPIRVEDSAWVGARAVVAPGVVVGRNALVRLGSTVTTDVPAVPDAQRWTEGE